MKPFIHSLSVLIAVVVASLAHGHGTPIQVSVDAGRLMVSGGVLDPIGYASNMFVEDDEDSDPFAEIPIQPFGPVIVWQIPGFDINGMDNDSSLSIEVLLRPVADSSPVEERTLWYWNDQTQLVEPAPTALALYLLARANQSRTLTPADLAAPSPLLLSDPMTGQQGFHNHGLLSYALDNDPIAPIGAYGFFARLTSDTYTPSDPFLVVLNRGISDYQQMIPAALAINAAAIDAEPIPGDYDADGHVDADDYAFWRARFGNTVTPFNSPDGNGNGTVDAADYVIWRNAASQLAAGALAMTAIPEAGAAALGCTALMSLVSIRRSRRRFQSFRKVALFGATLDPAPNSIDIIAKST